MRVAQPDDWRTRPMAEQRARLELDRSFDAREMQLIRAGVVPEQMEDKWFIVWEDDALSLYRSWTGDCIYRARFEPEGDGARLVEAFVDRSGARGENADDAYDAELLLFLIDALLLRAPVGAPSAERDPQQRALQTWGLIGRAMLGEHPE